MSVFRTAAAEPCPPRAELAGDARAVERVAAELRTLGVQVTAIDAIDAPTLPSACPAARAQVQLDDDGGILVAVRGARGSEGRVVSDAALAAAWIDSWTRDDVDRELLAAPAPSRVAAANAVTANGAAPAPSRAAVANARVAGAGAPAALADERVVAPSDVAPTSQVKLARSRWESIAIAASYEQMWTDDDASWTGIGAAACVRVGGFCVGARARLAFDPERLHNATAVERDDFSLLAVASYPVALGTMSIAPEVGLGLGRVATTRADGSCKLVMPPPNCDPTDPMCSMQPEPGGLCEPNADGSMTSPKVVVGDNFSAATYAPRISLALRIAIPVFEHVWLDGHAGMTYSPFAHGGDFAAGKTMATEVVSAEQIALPGEPSSGYVLGIGLRVGAK